MKKSIQLTSQSQLYEKLKTVFCFDSDHDIFIPTNADMNGYWNIGNYCCNESNIAATLKNCPIDGAFRMRIIYGTSRYYHQQWVYRFNTGETWFRMGDVNTRTWQSWRKLYG